MTGPVFPIAQHAKRLSRLQQVLVDRIAVLKRRAADTGARLNCEGRGLCRVGRLHQNDPSAHFSPEHRPLPRGSNIAIYKVMQPIDCHFSGSICGFPSQSSKQHGSKSAVACQFIGLLIVGACRQDRLASTLNLLERPLNRLGVLVFTGRTSPHQDSATMAEVQHHYGSFRSAPIKSVAELQKTYGCSAYIARHSVRGQKVVIAVAGSSVTCEVEENRIVLRSS